MKWIQNQQQQHLVDLEVNLSRSESLNQVGLISKKLEPLGNSKLSSDEIERRLTQVIRPKGQLRLRGLHLYDLMKSSAPLPVSIKGYDLGAVTDFPFVVGLAMRLHGDGAKTVGKKLCRSWQPFQNVVRDLGLKPLTTKESRNHPQAIDRWERLYEEVSMRSVKEAQKDVTWAKHSAVQCYYLAKRWKNDPEFKAKKIKQINKWRKDNPGRHQEICREWQANNKEYKLEYDKKWRAENPEKWKAIINTPINRVRRNIRKRLKDHLIGRRSANSHVGCSTNELKDYLSKQFKSQMTWENYGTVWHIDHIRPVASFDLSDSEQVKAVNHYTNLQPMYAKENMAKSDQWDGQHEFTHELL